MWQRYKQRRTLKRLDEIAEIVRQIQRQEEVAVKGPVDFAEIRLNMKPFPYQAKLLEDQNKRIVACMGRQTGKTTTIAMKAIYFADTNKNVTILITSPSLRQSMIMFDRIASFVFSSPYLRNKVVRAMRTLIHFENGSRIIALPCSENMLRGYTANMIVCLPGHAKITLADGREVPIGQIKSGQKVLSYNEERGIVEEKSVLRVHRNSLRGRGSARIFHEHGSLRCTLDHKVYALGRGFVEARRLNPPEKLLYLANSTKSVACPHDSIQQTPSQAGVNAISRAGYLWRPFGRFVHTKTKEDRCKCSPTNKSLLKTSRIRSIQVLNPEGFCWNSAENCYEQRMGKGAHPLWNIESPSIHRDISRMLQGREEDGYGRVAIENYSSRRVSELVHGRWEHAAQSNGCNKHPQIYVARARIASEMAEREMEGRASNNGRSSGKRLLLEVSRGGEGQVFQINRGACNPKHEIQNFAESGICNLRYMREEIQSEEKCKRDGEDHGSETLLQPKVSKDGKFKTTLQSVARTMQNLWKSFHPSHRKSGHMQQRVQSFIPLTAQTRMEPCLQTPQASLETESMSYMRSFLHPSKVSKNLQFRVQHATHTGISTSIQDEEETVYNLEVEGNHNYFADGVLVKNCDESSWIPEEVITQILFPMLSTTDGYAIFLSTPWDKNHFFYRAFINPSYSVHKVKSSECPLIKSEFLEEMRQNMTHEAYMMEYEAEFIEALNSYFPQTLIRGCVELAQRLDVELYQSLETPFPSGDYYCGVDFGKLQDYSIIAVLRREGDILKLVYIYQFPLGTPYTHVIGHLVRANQKFGFRQVLVDQTGVGEAVLEEIRNQGLRNVEGIKFTVQTKEDLLTTLKIMMEQNRLAIPYHRQLCEQINEQQYKYSKSGHLQFSHPENSHDDMLWALALAVYTAHQVKGPIQVEVAEKKW